MSTNGGIKRVVMDFDDLADGNDRFDVLMRLKVRDPGFKVTLFAIPNRCSDGLLSMYDVCRDWIQLGIHGFRHSRHEALGWMQDEAEDKLQRAMAIYPFAPIFKAPNWQMTDEVYAACKARNISVADHLSNVAIIPKEMPVYIYNIRLRDDPYTRIHGHIQDWTHTGTDGLEEAYEKWCSPEVGSEYLFVTDAITAWQGVG